MRLVFILGICLYRNDQHVLQLLPACAIVCILEFIHNVLSKLLDAANKRTSVKAVWSLFHSTVFDVSEVSHFTECLNCISSAFFRFLHQPCDRFESSHTN